MNQREYLLISGITFLLLGISGFIFLGPTKYDSILGELYWVSKTESFIYPILGLILLASFFKLKKNYLIKSLIFVNGLFFLLLSALGFLKIDFITPHLGQTWEKSPTDPIFFLVLSFWSFWVLLTDRK